MTVKELIEKLQEFDESMNVGVGDDFDGTYCEIDSLHIENGDKEGKTGWVKIYIN